MAEFAASIVAFIQLADGIIRICSQVIGSAKDAPRDVMMISGEVSSLRAILSCLTDVELNPMTKESIPALFAPSGPIQSCYQSIVELEKLLPKNPALNDPGALKRLTWALKEGKVRKLLAEISLHKSTLLLALNGDMMRDIKDIKSGVGRVEEALSRNERYEALAWLQFKCVNPSSMHLNTYRHHEKDTNSWLHKWQPWKSWLESGMDYKPKNRLIWIYGIPGSGKSVMASFIIESVKTHCQSFEHARLGYAYYYFHFSQNTGDSNPALACLKWMVGQFIRQAEWAPRQIKHLHDIGSDPEISELMDVLEQLLERFDIVHVMIDGLDEIESRSEMLDLLRQLATEARFGKLRLLVTSRPEHDIRETFRDISDAMSMSNHFVDHDIRVVVHSWITTNPKMRRWQHIHQDIEHALCEGAQGMIRWAACQMQIIERIREETKLVEALRDLPKDLHEIYMRELERLPTDDYLFVRRALLWTIGHASAGRLRDQGIHIDVLVSAVRNDLLHLTGKRWNYTSEDLKELSSCFITVRSLPLPYTDFLTDLRIEKKPEDEQWWIYRSKASEHQDVPQGEFVRIAHYTVVEFLQSHRRTTTNQIHRLLSLGLSTVEHDFFMSVLRQALTVDPSSTSVDWVRDREAYCLTLAPLIMSGSNIPASDPAILDLCISFFLPTNPHYQRLRLIQCYLVAGCEEARAFYAACLPICNPGLPPANPIVWALLGMIVSSNYSLARLAFQRVEVNPQDFKQQHIVGSFASRVPANMYGDPISATGALATLGEEWELVAWIRQLSGPVPDVLEARCCYFDID